MQDGAAQPKTSSFLKGLAIATCCHHLCQWKHYISNLFMLLPLSQPEAAETAVLVSLYFCPHNTVFMTLQIGHTCYIWV